MTQHDVSHEQQGREAQVSRKKEPRPHLLLAACNAEAYSRPLSENFFWPANFEEVAHLCFLLCATRAPSARRPQRSLFLRAYAFFFLMVHVHDS